MSFTNMNSTIAENIKYFMYKYNFTYYDWFGPLHVILKKIENVMLLIAPRLMIFVLPLPSESYVMKETHVICLMYMHTRPSKL